ncbi:MAG: hypothetical protein EPO46_08845 [Lysobacter sp.]|nr:MAG: hypothetical protein EPO46_08845 [Lysobacter sp.]
MNALCLASSQNPTSTQATPTTRGRVSATPFASGNRLGAPERDFGIGYGKSSGYAASRRYTAAWTQPPFRFA